MSAPKQRLFRWALWWGLGIVVVCLAILLIGDIDSFFGPSDGTPSTDGTDLPIMVYFYRVIFKFGIWPIVIFIGVITPIYEELIFRGWGNGKSWTGYITVTLMALFIATLEWWIGLIALVAGIVILVKFDSDRTKRLFALMILSSLLFALAHIANYDASEDLLTFIFGVLHKFGMGLVASYLVINHNILWAIGFHTLNNGIMAILLGIGFSIAANDETVIETDDYRITSKPMLTENRMPDTYDCGWLNDSVFFHIESPDFAAELFINYGDHETPSLDIQSEWNPYPKMKIKVEMLGGSRDYNAVLHTMEKKGWIALDTIDDAITIRNTYNPLEDL